MADFRGAGNLDQVQSPQPIAANTTDRRLSDASVALDATADILKILGQNKAAKAEADALKNKNLILTDYAQKVKAIEDSNVSPIQKSIKTKALYSASVAANVSLTKDINDINKGFRANASTGDNYAAQEDQINREQALDATADQFGMPTVIDSSLTAEQNAAARRNLVIQYREDDAAHKKAMANLNLISKTNTIKGQNIDLDKQQIQQTADRSQHVVFGNTVDVLGMTSQNLIADNRSPEVKLEEWKLTYEAQTKDFFIGGQHMSESARNWQAKVYGAYNEKMLKALDPSEAGRKAASELKLMTDNMKLLMLSENPDLLTGVVASEMLGHTPIAQVWVKEKLAEESLDVYVRYQTRANDLNIDPVIDLESVTDSASKVGMMNVILAGIRDQQSDPNAPASFIKMNSTASNNTLTSLANNVGKITSPKQIQPTINYYASPEFHKQFKDGHLDETALDRAKPVVQAEYVDKVVPMIRNEFSKTLPGFDLAMSSYIDPVWEGNGVSFKLNPDFVSTDALGRNVPVDRVSLQLTEGQMEQLNKEIRRLNGDTAKLLNTTINASSVVIGRTTDTKKVWEESIGPHIFGAPEGSTLAKPDEEFTPPATETLDDKRRNLSRQFATPALEAAVAELDPEGDGRIPTKRLLSFVEKFQEGGFSEDEKELADQLKSHFFGGSNGA